MLCLFLQYGNCHQFFEKCNTGIILPGAVVQEAGFSVERDPGVFPYRCKDTYSHRKFLAKPTDPSDRPKGMYRGAQPQFPVSFCTSFVHHHSCIAQVIPQIILKGIVISVVGDSDLALLGAVRRNGDACEVVAVVVFKGAGVTYISQDNCKT